MSTLVILGVGILLFVLLSRGAGGAGASSPGNSAGDTVVPPNDDPDVPRDNYGLSQKDKNEWNAAIDPVISWHTQLRDAFDAMVNLDNRECSELPFRHRIDHAWRSDLDRIITRLQNRYITLIDDLGYIRRIWITGVEPSWQFHIDSLRHDEIDCANMMADTLKNLNDHMRRFDVGRVTEWFNGHPGVDSQIPIFFPG